MQTNQPFADYVTTTERYALKRGYLVSIDVVLRVRFPADSASLSVRVRKIEDPDQLAVFLAAIESAAAPDDLLKLLPRDDAATDNSVGL